MTTSGASLLPSPPPGRRRGLGDMLGGPAGWIAAAAFAVVVMVALFVAAAAAAVIAVLAAVAVLVLRLSPRRSAGGPAALEGRRTAEGWVAEAASR